MGARVLLVDDEPNLVAPLAYLLRRAGWTTAVAVDGRSATDAVAAQVPDVVLLDVMLPDVDGYALCAQLRREHPDLRIVIVSAKGRAGEVAKGLAHGADAYVTKPFASRDLLDAVARLVPGAPAAGCGGTAS